MPVKKTMTVVERADQYNPPVDHQKEITALRKSLRWALGMVPTYGSNLVSPEKMFCTFCEQRGHLPSKIVHSEDCLYAIASKLVGLPVKVKK